MPNWDHTPRSGTNAPELFEIHARNTIEAVINKPQNRRICFLKSWYEWGEGNYMEPDLKYGKGYLKALRRAISFFV